MSTLERVVPGTVGLLVCGAPTAYLLWLCWAALASRRWPTAPGRVTRSVVVAGHRHQARYDVRYEYTVGGRAYTGGRVRFGGALNMNRGDALRTTTVYPAGRPVQVRHHPRRPRVSTLESRVSAAVWVWLALGLFMTSAIAGALLGWWE
ncbi:MAG TPA: DUF3592 domain-containing protein [Longimicrobium sp.]|jgi:hypothetical protein